MSHVFVYSSLSYSCCVFSIRHRGPDWSGVHVWKDRVLAHERLAIVDVEHGAQPLRNETSDVWLAVNGEVSNTTRDDVGSHNAEE